MMWLSGPDIQNGICRDCFFLKQGRALEAVITTNEPLINIAMRFGFDSQQSLTRAFRKRYNVPPHRCRKNAVSIKSKSSREQGNYSYHKDEFLNL